jgi:hypothetical protein
MKRGSLSSPIAAVVSVVAASACCLPLGYFVAGAGLFGMAGFFGAAQPYLLGLSVLSLVLGFVRTYGRRSCTAGRSQGAVVLLWTATALVLGLFLFPQQIAGVLADLFPGRG